MNRMVFYFGVVIMTIFLAGCDKNNSVGNNESYALINENPLHIKAQYVENSRGDISSVQMVLTYFSSDKEWISLTSTAEYKNNGFELNFSEPIPEEYLLKESKIYDNIILSDINARTYLTSSGFIYAVNSSGGVFGGFSFSLDDWVICLLYADRDFTAKGITERGVEYDCSYKKGWNIEYERWLGGSSYQHTTQRPSNNNIKCHFFEYVYL